MQAPFHTGQDALKGASVEGGHNGGMVLEVLLPTQTPRQKVKQPVSQGSVESQLEQFEDELLGEDCGILS